MVELPGPLRRSVRRPASSKPYSLARRPAFARGTVKPVSCIPSGPKMRRASTSPSGASSMPRDEQAKQIGRVAIVQCGAGLVDQRQGGKSCDPIVGRHLAVDIAAKRLCVGLRDGTGMLGPIGEARAVRQQVLKGNRPFGRDSLVERPRGRAQDAHVRKLWGPAPRSDRSARNGPPRTA